MMQPKRLRLINKHHRWSFHKKQTINLNKASNKSKKTIYGKVLCQKDYLSVICYFLTINDIFKSIPLISTFHKTFVNHVSQKRLIETCMSYDQLETALEIIEFKLSYDINDGNGNESDTEKQVKQSPSVSKQLSMIYGMTWDDLVTTVKKIASSKGDSRYPYDFGLGEEMYIAQDPLPYTIDNVLYLKNAVIAQFWLTEVKIYPIIP